MYKNSNTKLQAHKGCSFDAPENTMASYKLAVKLGYEFIELDPKISSDLVPVLIHDQTLNRTARKEDGSTYDKEIKVSDLTFDELQKFDVGLFKGEEFRGEKIPKFFDALKFITNAGLSVKVDNCWENFSEDGQTALLNDVKKLGNNVGMTCAKMENFKKILELFPNNPIHYDGVVNDETLNEIKSLANGKENLYIWVRFANDKTNWCKNPAINKELSDKVKKVGKLGVWLIDNESEMPEVLTYDPFVVETNGGVKP